MAARMDATPPPLSPEAPSFSSIFPPPYRVLLLVSVGLVLFGSNFHLLGSRGIDLWSLVRTHDPAPHPNAEHGDATIALERLEGAHRAKAEVLPTSRAESSSLHDHLPCSPPPSAAAGHRSASAFYVAGVGGLVWSLLGWWSYRYYVDRLYGDPKGRHAQALQAVAVMGAVGALLWPGNVFNRPGRRAFGRSLLRILTPSLSQTITFADVLLADVLTSFAKVLGDVWLTACFLVPRAEHHTWWNGKGSIVVPLLISLPYAVRLRQCLSEYNVTNRRAPPRPSRPLTGGRSEATNKKPLWNAAKYASAFPVIWLSAWYDADKVVGSSGEWNTTFNLWLLSVFVNSFYSFWWDVTNDWGLSVLSWSALTSAGSVSKTAPKSLHKRGVSSFSFLQHHGHRKSDVADEGSLLPLDSLEEGDSTPTSRPRPPPPSWFLSSPGHAAAARHGRTASLLETVLRPRAPSLSGSLLLFHPTTYQLAIVLDLVLRFFWSLKLSSHLHHVVEWQGGVFVMEALEIARRWVWMFFRVEWEVVRRSRMDASVGARQD
ncbi:protein-ER retention protein [Thecaphora frezii]